MMTLTARQIRSLIALSFVLGAVLLVRPLFVHAEEVTTNTTSEVETTVVAESNSSQTVEMNTVAETTSTVVAESKTYTNPKPPYKGCMMEITKTANVTSPKVGDEVTYTINFKNTGTGDCTGGGVKVADVLPREVSYVSESHSSNVTAGYHGFGTYHAGSHVVYWNAATLNPGETGWVKATVKIKERQACGNFSITNTAKITSYELDNFTKWIETSVSTDVKNACPAPTPVCTLEANPTTITKGGTTILSWTSSNANTVTIDNGIGALDAAGKTNASPEVTTTYTLTAVGDGGTVSCPVTVTVHTPDPEPTLTCDAFTATPNTFVGGGTTTLSWNTSNATGVTIDQGIGAVDQDGTKDVLVSESKTFTLTATRGTESITCTAPVTVTATPAEPTPRCDSFTVSDSSVRRGDSVTLTWETTDAVTASIDNGIGAVAVDGSQSVTVQDAITYVLTLVNGNETRTCSVGIGIESSGGGGGGGGSSSPRCELKASDTSVKAGEKVTLTWKNLRTNDILLKDERGNTLLDSKKDSKIDEDAGSVDVRPVQTTKYTLTAIKGSKDRTCTVTVNVDGVTVTSTRTQDPLVAGISLSRLPYTGFEAGPLLTATFYGLLILWALVVAYFLVIRRESVLGVSLPQGKSNTTPVAMPRVNAPRVSEVRFTPKYGSAPQNLPVGNMATVDAPRGYEAYYEQGLHEVEEAPMVTESVRDEEAQFAFLEARAQDAHVLMSTDALRFIMAQGEDEHSRIDLLDMVILTAKAQYPSEDGWIVINKERILSLLK